MSEEPADSGSEESSSESGIDMEAALDTISEDLFPAKEEPAKIPDEEYDVVEEIVEEVEAEPAEKEEPEEDPHPAPQSWKKEMHEFWKGLDPAVQNYVEQRESQMKEGLEKDRGDATLGRDMRDVISPYADMLRAQGINEKALLTNLVNAHVRLSSADDTGKADLFRQLAQSYNVSLDGQPPADVDPALKAVQSKVNSLEQHLSMAQQRSQQELNERIQTELEAFVSDPDHEFFDEVVPQLVDFIHLGHPLEEAYKLALKANPVTYQTELDRQVKEAVEKALTDKQAESKKAEKAKSTNVRGRDTNKAPTEPLGTMEDTMREVMRDIQNRSH